jgi:hypothetical protein
VGREEAAGSGWGGRRHQVGEMGERREEVAGLGDEGSKLRALPHASSRPHPRGHILECSR